MLLTDNDYPRFYGIEENDADGGLYCVMRPNTPPFYRFTRSAREAHDRTARPMVQWSTVFATEAALEQEAKRYNKLPGRACFQRVYHPPADGVTELLEFWRKVHA